MTKTVAALLLASSGLLACETIIPIGPDPTGGNGGSAGAAGAGGGAPAGYMSGTRLKARHLTGDDGSDQLVGWYDSGRGENCTYRKAADGVVRCLPDGVATSPLFYSDAGCTAPVAKIVKGIANTAPAPAYVGRFDPTTGQTAVFVTGAMVGGGQFYFGNPTSCSGPGSVDATEVVYAAGAELPASSFAAATETHD